MNPEKEEVRRLLDVLRTILRLLAVSNREVERRLGLKHSGLTRVFNGQIEAKLELVLGAARAVGLEYDELFAFAYPERRAPAAESAAAQRIRSLLKDLHPGALAAPRPVETPVAPVPARPAPAAVDRDQLMADLKKAIREVLEGVDTVENGPKPENGE